jgi:tetratricopeptide (TPR) repeat protein
MEATTLSNLATTHYRAGRLPEAATVVSQALAARRSLNDRRGEGNILRLKSDLECERGEAGKALESAHGALDIALSLRDPRLEGYWLITLGNAQQAGGHFADALTSYHRSAALHRRLADRSREALAWHGVGETYRRLDRHAEAAGFHRQAAAAHHELGDAWHEALALDGLGTAVLSEDPEAALRHWSQALRILADYDDPRAVATRDRVAGQLARAGSSTRP